MSLLSLSPSPPLPLSLSPSLSLSLSRDLTLQLGLFCVSSPEVYARRSSSGCAEHCLYVSVRNVENSDIRLYTRSIGHHRLVLIPGLPALPWGGSILAVGSRIYVFGGVKMTSSAFSIDCRSHTVQPLPSMPFPMSPPLWMGGSTLLDVMTSTQIPRPWWCSIPKHKRGSLR